MKANEYEWQKKPVIIEAWKLDAEALHTMPLWLAAGLDKDVNYAGAVRVLTSVDDNSTIGMNVFTLEGVMTADVGDYIIRGVKGEIYPCKPDIFEATYERPGADDVPTVGLTFSVALVHLKRGKRVAREGWNGKGMFLFLVPGSEFKVNRPPLLGIYAEGTPIKYHAHVDMKTATGDVVPWLCSQTDMLADDWCVLDSEPELPFCSDEKGEGCDHHEGRVCAHPEGDCGAPEPLRNVLPRIDGFYAHGDPVPDMERGCGTCMRLNSGDDACEECSESGELFGSWPSWVSRLDWSKRTCWQCKYKRGVIGRFDHGKFMHDHPCDKCTDLDTWNAY